MECIECGRVYVRDYRVCPECGTDQDPDGDPARRFDDDEPADWEVEQDARPS